MELEHTNPSQSNFKRRERFVSDLIIKISKENLMEKTQIVKVCGLADISLEALILSAISFKTIFISRPYVTTF